MAEPDFVKIQEKWQKRWNEAKIFEADPDKRKKFFLNFPYPYINAYQHIGHLYTLMRVESFARYKRMKGFNVLFPQGWHVTGSPIVQAAKRVKAKEPKQLKIMEDMGFSEKDLPKFEDPKYWIDFFAPEYKKDYRSIGMSVDWRREFYTTDLNPRYDKFIRWQFRKLKEKNYVIKGKFPVVWDPKENVPVGDHDRTQGEGEVPQEFCLFKFPLEDGRNLMTATLRPDTIWGITNVYANPEAEYVEIETKGEKWIVGKPMIKKLRDQDWKVNEIGKANGKDLIGKKVTSFGGKKILVLPATFLDPNYGTGMVHSVPSDSADDLIALRDLQKDDKTIKKYGLGAEEVKAIEPIEIFETPEIGGNSAQYFLDKYGVKSQNERAKLENIKKELYKLTFTTSRLGKLYKKGFSKDLAGMEIPKAQQFIKKELLKQGKIELFYELTGKVVSRSLTECIVKIVSDQWFIDYDNEAWKRQAHKCLDKMQLFPEKARQQFEYVIDWLHAWACTRESGLGTRLPWDDKWLIESLSDSTIYMAYYTIVHLLNKIPEDQIDDALFDYVLLGKNSKIKVDKKKADEMRASFEYWYPVDFRNSGKDLIQNHLTFFIFNHVAIFPEKHWPKGIGTNGWVTVDGQKMSKSLGNMIPVREMVKTFGADASRFTILSGGESMDDPNWDTELARSMPLKFKQLIENYKEQYGKGVSDERPIDKWMDSRLNATIKEATEAMENTLFRTALQKIFFELPRNVKWYMRRCNNQPNKKLTQKIIETQLIMLTPFIPHTCEEAWEQIGKKGFISEQEWPGFEEKKILAKDPEENIRTALSDVNAVLKLAKLEKPKKIQFFVSAEWKYGLYELLRKKLGDTRNPKEVIAAVMATDLKKYSKEVMKIVPRIIKAGAVPDFTSQKEELQGIKDASEFLKAEFGAAINVEIAENTKEAKAGNAMPGKPAILVE